MLCCVVSCLIMNCYKFTFKLYMIKYHHGKYCISLNFFNLETLVIGKNMKTSNVSIQIQL